MALGRPRAFDKEATLEKVVDVFWTHGYEGSSMATLTAATGLSKPSLYAAFGDKEQLFKAAFARYRARQTEFASKALAHPQVRAGVESLLLGLVDRQTQAGKPHGCLMVHGNLVGTPESRQVREELQLHRRAVVSKLRERLRKAQAEGDFPASVDAADYALFITTLIQGLAVQAAGGASRKSLHRVVKLGMQAWPGGE